ncbi:Lrp/AsnC family transcriptional regulator [Kordiimonas pumila]|uniref:Lrp/AsnC family transcriptional regulator n=1 Tax=Kordiimonas pumila TaxID=2161677 RepID=A0ABV7D4X7_9PROT|nr:Lrp/AsnC family transcriptional regulator [Kordiimonas pumila]
MTDAPKIDFLDVKILDVLQKDARITKTKLSEQIGLSATPCHIRIKKLEEQGFINGYYADIDYTAFGGFSFYWVQIQLLGYSKEKAIHFEKIVMQFPEILECIATLGKVDYLIKIAAKTVQSYQEILERLLETEGVDLDFITFPMVKQIKAPWQSDLIKEHEKPYRNRKS